MNINVSDVIKIIDNLYVNYKCYVKLSYTLDPWYFKPLEDPSTYTSNFELAFVDDMFMVLDVCTIHHPELNIQEELWVKVYPLRTKHKLNKVGYFLFDDVKNHFTKVI